MMTDPAFLFSVFWHFFYLSLLGIGGFMVTVPEIYRWLVESAGIMTSVEFQTAVALGQANPGPNVLIVWALGWFVGGPAGALAAIAGTAIPYSCIAFTAGRTFRHFSRSLWVRAFRCGMTPVSIGLLYATGAILVGPEPSWSVILTAAATTVLVWKTGTHMLVLISAGAFFGALGWI